MNKTDNIITRLIDKVNANTDSINAIKRALSIKSLEPQTSSSSSGEGTDDHSQLINRDAADSHPASAITGLSDFMAAMNEMFELEGAGASASPYVIKAKHDLYSIGGVSAYGQGSGGGGGASNLYQLNDVPDYRSLANKILKVKSDHTIEWADMPTSAVWGNIAGTLSNQTDLANALAGKADASSLANYLTISAAASTYHPKQGSASLSMTASALTLRADNNYYANFIIANASGSAGYLYIQPGQEGIGWRDTVLNSSGGNVGVGTTSPLHKLDVNGTFRATGSVRSDSEFRVYNSDSYTGFIMMSGNNLKIGSLKPGVAYTNTIICGDGGNVGIGTASPTKKLHIKSTSSGPQVLCEGVTNYDIGVRAKGSTYELEFIIGSGGVNRGIYDINNSSWMIYRDSTTNILIPQGNVGIGTSSPSAKLDVNGALILRNGAYSVKIEVDSSGNLKVNGNVLATGGVTAYN